MQSCLSIRITDFAAVTVKRMIVLSQKNTTSDIHFKISPNCESALYIILAFAFAVHYLPLNILVDFLKSFLITVRTVT